MRDWRRERALEAGVSERLKRYSDREGLRQSWYELGFIDGWEAAFEQMKEQEEKVYGEERSTDR